jgi:hypothetical protein
MRCSYRIYLRLPQRIKDIITNDKIENERKTDFNFKKTKRDWHRL